MASCEELLDKMNECIEELQKAEITVVEALKKLTCHNTDPKAHPNMSCCGNDLALAKLAEQMLVLNQRVSYVESNDIEQDEKLSLIQGGHIGGESSGVPEAVWNGTELSFRYPDGTTTNPVDLKGPKGDCNEIEITSDLNNTATDIALSALGGKKLKDMIDSGSNGGVTIYDGTIDFDDEEQINEITENKPLGHIIAYDCCPNCEIPDEEVVIGGNFNSDIWITESQDWVVPVTGIYDVLIINGGQSGRCYYNNVYIDAIGGAGGNRIRKLLYLKKDTIIPVTIGAGGVADGVSNIVGGITEFGEYTGSDQGCELFPMTRNQQVVDTDATHVASASGSGIGGGWSGQSGLWYGGGGSGYIVVRNKQVTDALNGDGYQGAVYLRWYDASKDKNISIDMASSITMKELQEQIKTLTIQIQELKNE